VRSRISGLLLASMVGAASGAAGSPVASSHPADVLARLQLVPDQLPLESSKPVVVLVHGINAGPEVFDVLARGLAQRGFQVVRFRYDYEDNLERSADRFVRAVRTLRNLCAPPSITVIAHSMGGLVARRAMTVGRPETLAEPAGGLPIRLVTVASPFGGFSEANLTRLWVVRILAAPFGVMESHANLGSRSSFICQPGSLGANVSHVKAETEEEGKTRLDWRGRRERDTVARRRNQRNPIVDADARARVVHIDAGHVGVIEDHREVPQIFWDALEDSGMLARDKTAAGMNPAEMNED